MTITEKTETDWSTDNNNNCIGESESDYDAKSFSSRNTFQIMVQQIEMTQDLETASYLEMPFIQEEKPLNNMFIRISSVLNTSQIKHQNQSGLQVDTDPLNLINQDISELSGIASPRQANREIDAQIGNLKWSVNDRAESRLDYFDDLTTESTALQKPCSLDLQADTPNLPFFDRRQSKMNEPVKRQNNFFPAGSSSCDQMSSSQHMLAQQLQQVQCQTA